MARYVALLRGINVGGKNPVRMPALADCFRDAGFTDVQTYIQSGNVLFSSKQQSRKALESRLDTLLGEVFGFPIPTVVRSRDDLAGLVASAPAHMGAADMRSDVLFLKHPLTVKEAMVQMPDLREGVDVLDAAADAFYFSRVDALASKSRITRLVAMPVYKHMTVRNWRTTTRLLALLNED